MGVIASFAYRPDGYVLSETIEQVPEVELEIVQMMGTDPECPSLWTWMRGAYPEQFEAAMDRDTSVGSWTVLTETESQTLYQIQANGTSNVNYPLWLETGVELCEQTYRDGVWHLRIRLPDRGTLSTVQEWCDATAVEYDLKRVGSDNGRRESNIELSDQQRAVLQVALEQGYFEIPRKGDLEDVASELGISSQAASERLRRGHRKLVSHHL